MYFHFQGHILCQGVTVPLKIWEAIEALSPKPSKDKIYIKDVALVTFGPEVLASSTIFGTNRGRARRRGTAEEQGDKEAEAKKPALNPKLLQVVKGIVLNQHHVFFRIRNRSA